MTGYWPTTANSGALRSNGWPATSASRSLTRREDGDRPSRRIPTEQPRCLWRYFRHYFSVPICHVILKQQAPACGHASGYLALDHAPVRTLKRYP